MAFFCIPIIFGFPTFLKPDGDQTPRICPRCHNPAVTPAKSRTWFEFCFVPLIPFPAKHLWICNICHWKVPLQQNWEPTLPSNQPRPHDVPSPPNPSYQPAYVNRKS